MANTGFKQLFNSLLTDFTDAAGATSLTAGSLGAGDLETVGSIRQEGENFYRWVENGESSALTAGEAVTFKLANAGTAFKQIVYDPIASTLNFMAGICMSNIPANGYGWIQIEGWKADAHVKLSSNSTAVLGQILVCGSADQNLSNNGFNITDGMYTRASRASSATNASAAAVPAINISANMGYAILGETTASSGTEAFTRELGVWIHCMHV